MSVKQELLNECYTYRKLGARMNPLDVEVMIAKAYRDGYEKAIKNYVEPYTNKEEE